MAQVNCASCGHTNSEFNLTCSRCGARIPLRSAEASGDPGGPAASDQAQGLEPPVEASAEYIGGRFKILALLGEGGMGRVFRARDTQLDRDVALKVLHAGESTRSAAADRLLREARLASALNHPNIVTTYDVSLTGEVAFISMEFIEGTTLEALLRSGPLPHAQVADLGRQMADGVQAAHRAGILHLDLQPANVMVTAEGVAKILDFGLAGVRRESSEAKQTGGTPQFMAPEQLAGESVDERTDIFALGLLLYLMLTGEHPFAEDGLAPRARGLSEADTPHFGSLLDRGWRTCLGRALAADPGRRFPSMEHFSAAIAEWAGPGAIRDQAGTAVVAATSRPLSAWWQKSQPALLGSVAFLVVAVLALLVYFRLPGENEVDSAPDDGLQNLVVLPFQTSGPVPLGADYRDGLLVALTKRLSEDSLGHERLRVIPAGELKRKRVTHLFQVRERLRADLAINGTLKADRERIKLRLELVDVDRLSVLRSENLECDRGNLLSLVESTHQRISGFLKLTGTANVAALAAASDESVGAYDAYLVGQGLLFRDDRKGNLGRAVTAFEGAVQLAPERAVYRAALAQALLRRFQVLKKSQDLAAARTACRRALELNDQLALGWQTLGSVELEQGHYREAIAALDRARVLNPLDFNIYLRLGRVYARSGDPRAEDALLKARELRPDHWKTHLQLGTHYTRLGRFDQAETCFQAMIELVPDNSMGYQNLATVYQLQDRLELALDYYQKALEIRPGGAITLSNMGAIFMSMGRYEEAARAFERAVALNDRNPNLLAQLADFSEQKDFHVVSVHSALRVTNNGLASSQPLSDTLPV